jgi:hypothetical protein
VTRPLTGVVVACCLLAACSSKGGSTAAPTTSTSAATAPATTAVVASAVPRTCSADTFATTASPPPQGSAPLADGHYFGYVTKVDARAATFLYDVAQLFTGAAAVQAAKDDGGESPPPNDYWIRNQSSLVRPMPLATDAALCVPTDTNRPTSNNKVDLARFARVAADGEPLPAWIDVHNGAVERVEQQFFP